MDQPHWHRRALVVPFAILLLGTLIGGQLNRVDARGRIVDDTTGSPVPGVTVSYGSRSTVTDDDGRYALDNLPRGARLDTQQKYYGRHPVAADATELRIEPLTITFQVNDATTGKGVDTPEARQPDDTQIGKGTSSGQMVVGPYPARNAPVLICAKSYQSTQVTPKGYQMDVQLTPSAGAECPPLKNPPPTPSPSPSLSPSPSGSAAPAPSATAAPSASP
ncbi:MAG TPA: carboxypeptidase regulatory-like domain-containing protein [Candidatus Limnocylindria bacterium]|nr:carboxypeptidase regulatory-like domain-containing protein [Candidatus Limnocylindria bacterium]